ncbi:chromosome segregation protein SMC [Lactobacillus delbrueckii subsp. bulgaricus]|uniref:chromosome segregation protein SMC n=1 Tax=Lactobacillus delbrueckii TaxID=1584 RepID=UPI001E29C6F9|nr:chromosome segregation protein SMC [Lactobacillus delbrueckii subsp. bulgaricus]
MPLTSLILEGFKSFADKTVIDFTKGITGIVGPNGSGKSNITEAIRWVMGEGSAKSLRGRNMKDVIFAGSQFRKPLNRAEVTMVFDNRDRELDFSADQVSITRRILKSGDNEYLINQQPVRLRDVRALFLDSGISQNSLAIISQGRVDQILNSQARERRGIFEEAAGVLHFKQQKQQAQRQLETTNDNLIRINDLVNELEKRLEPLHEQSSLAQEYQFQKAALDEDLKTLLAFEIADLDQEEREVSQKLAKSQELLSRLDAEVKQSQAKLAAKRQEFQLESQKRDQVQAEVLKLTNRLSEINTSLQVSQQSRQFDQATRLEYQRQLADLKENLAATDAEISKLADQEAEYAGQLDQLKCKRQKLVDQLKEDPASLKLKVEDLRSQYIQTLQDQTSVNNQLVYLEGEIKRAKESKDQRYEDASSQLAKSQEELEGLRLKEQKLRAENDQLQAELKEASDQLGKLAAEQQVAQKQLQADLTNLQRLTARRDALVNIQKRHDGYYAGVKQVLNQPDRFPGIIGAVGELLTFPADLEAAMTTALGGNVQSLVAKDRMAAKDAIQQLKVRRLGRATFLPLDALRYRAIPASTRQALERFAGFQGLASELVEAKGDTDISEAIQYLLGSIIIVDNMDTALAVSRQIGHYRVVTLDGDVISPGGAMTGGARNQRNNSPLQTTAEINKTTAMLEELERQFHIKEEKLAGLDKQVKDKQETREQISRDLQSLQQDLSAAVLTFQSQEKEVKRLESVVQLYQAQQAEQAAYLADLTDKEKAQKIKKEELAALADQQKRDLASLQETIQNYTDLNQGVQEKLAELDPQLAVLANKQENLQARKAELGRQKAAIQKQIGQLEEKLAALDNSSQLSARKKEELGLEKDRLLAEQKDKQADLDAASQLLGQLNGQINQLEAVATRNYDLRKDAASEQEELSVKLATVKGQLKQHLDSLREDYSLTYEAALSQAKLENTEENQQNLRRSVKLHRMSLEDIGPVNLGAIDEYKEVKDRYDFLNGQQNDLLEARSNLQQSMDELDQEVKGRFGQTFQQISASFSRLFPVVFGGGNARLTLTDPDNLLESGVEIIAQPPGKKLQRLSLLSGGERSLTAITLLFAMLEVNPVPFCVLDEVEAALDDANVARFARFLRQYDSQTQFIVITHRRGTMEQADQLYGVVMQESGVSQILSVSLKDLKDEV